MNRIQNRLVLMGSGHGQDGWMRTGDVFRFCPETTGHDYPTVFCQGLANCFEALGLCTVKKSTGVYDHGICSAVVGRDCIALCAQPGENAFAIHQRLWATKRDHTDGGLPHAPFGGHTGACQIWTKV